MKSEGLPPWRPVATPLSTWERLDTINIKFKQPYTTWVIRCIDVFCLDSTAKFHVVEVF